MLLGCRSDPAAAPTTPAPGAGQKGHRESSPPESRTHRRPVRRPLVPAGQGVVVRLEMEGKDCVCRINQERIGVYPDTRVVVVKHLDQLNPEPRSKVALLDIHPRVPHALVNLLLTDCQLAGFKKLSFADPGPSDHRSP
jgi:hypothetical protein